MRAGKKKNAVYQRRDRKKRERGRILEKGQKEKRT